MPDTPTANTPRYCATCVHVQRGEPSLGTVSPTAFWRCTAPQLYRESQPDPVSGEVRTLFCETARQRSELCGPDGKFWELRKDGK